MATYSVIGVTNGWVAARVRRFSGRTKIVLVRRLPLRDAQLFLLDLFNEMYADSLGVQCTWWGAAMKRCPLLTWSHSDGTRGFEYDSQYFKIVEDATEVQD